MTTKLYFKINYIKSMALITIAFVTIAINRISIAQELIYNEEMTTSNLDFYDSGNNSGEIIDSRQNTRQNDYNDNFKQLQQQQQQLQQRLWNNDDDVDENNSSTYKTNNNNSNKSENGSNKFLSLSSSSSSSAEEEITQKNGFLMTTMVPLPDYIQMFSSLSSSLSPVSSIGVIDNADEDDYIKENESRSSTSFDSNEAPPSFSMRKSVLYAPQKDINNTITNNSNIDNDLSNNLSIPIISNDSGNNTYNISDGVPNILLTPSVASFSSPVASALLSPYIPSLSSSDEEFNQSQILMMGDDAFTDQDIETSHYNKNPNYNVDPNEDVENDDYDHIVAAEIDDNSNNGDVGSSSSSSGTIDIDQIDNVGTTTLTSIPTVRTKQGKQIQIIKLLPHEALRNFIEDAYIRMPLAALIDTSSESLERAKALWKDALRPNAALDIVLLAFNASGVSVTYHFQNTRTLLAGLDSIKESTTGGNAFFAIIRACELIPYDSAVFISTASIPADTNLAQYAAITLLKKRIRLYLIWFGENTYSENETQEVTGGILGEVAIRSGGEILHIGNDTKYEEDNMLTIVSENYRGNQEFDIPIETTMSNLHVKVDGVMKTATLVTPNGEFNLKNIRRRKINDKIQLKSMKNSTKGLEILIILRKYDFPSTHFHFKLIPENDRKDFNVLIKSKERYLENFQASNDDSNEDDEDDDLQTLKISERSENKLSIESQEDSAIITHENVRFPDDVQEKNNSNENNDDDNIETIETVEHKVKMDETSKQQQQTDVFQERTQINLGIQSQLLVTPGMIAQIYFEITNTRTEPVFHNIRVIDERGFLLTLNPRSIWLPPGQTQTVVLSVIIPANTPQGTKDEITFTCQGYGEASQSLELKVISTSDIQDTTPPTITWTFGTRCDNQWGSNSCSQRIWSLEVTAQDWETGILRIESVPKGIIARIPFTVGTTNPVRASYSATCCKPRVTIIAYDLAGNQRTSTIDVRDIVLTEASIAAIVLGILLLIALIILVVIGIIWCCKKRKESHDLSSYRSHAERTR